MYKAAVAFLATFLFYAQSAFAIPLIVDTVHTKTPLTPELVWLSDPSGTLTLESVRNQDDFTLLREGFPMQVKGPVWLKLLVKRGSQSALTPMAEQQQLAISLGKLPNDTATVYMRAPQAQLSANVDVWTTEVVGSFEEVILPSLGQNQEQVFIRLEENPGLWFAPTIYPAKTLAPDLLPPDLLLPGLLLLGAIVCLLRALKGKAMWSFWASVYLGLGIVQAIMPLPLLQLPITYENLPALLAPGLCLLVLPNLGRSMLQTGAVAPMQDKLLAVASVLGIAVALGPLLPQYHWIIKLFPLWPLLLLPVLPICLWGLTEKRSGSLAFAGACFMPFIGAVMAFFEINAPIQHPLVPQGTLWGMAIGGLGLALAHVVKEHANAGLEINHDSLIPPQDDALTLGSLAATPVAASLNALPSFADNASPAPIDTLNNMAETLRLDAPSTPGLDHLKKFAQTEASIQPATSPRAQQTANDANLLNMHMPPTAKAEPLAAFSPSLSLDMPSVPKHLELGINMESLREPTPAPVPDTPLTQAGIQYTVIARADDEGADTPVAMQPTEPQLLHKTVPPAPLSIHPAAEALPIVEPLTIVDPNELQADTTSPISQHVAEPVAAAASTQDATPHAASDAEWQQPEEINSDAWATESRTEVPSATATSTDDETAMPFAQVEQPTEAALPVEEVMPNEATTPIEAMPFAKVELPAEAAQLPNTTTSVGPASHQPKVISLENDELDDAEALLAELDTTPARNVTLAASGNYIFNLQGLVKEVYDAVVPLAKAKGIALSWFVQPSLPVLLEGEAPRLRQALHLLLQNSVQATNAGSVELSVRKNVAHTDACSLIFTITDTGTGNRSDAGFFHSWDIASRTGGTFIVEYADSANPCTTLTVNFAIPSEQEAMQHLAAEAQKASVTSATPAPTSGGTLAPCYAEAETAHLSPEEVMQQEGFLEMPLDVEAPAASAKTGIQQAEQQAEQQDAAPQAEAVLPRVIIADMTTSNLRLTTHYLQSIAYDHVQAKQASTVAELFKETPAQLILFDADMPESDMQAAIASIRQNEAQNNLGKTPIVALTSHKSQVERMFAIGCSDILLKPFSQPELVAMVEYYLYPASTSSYTPFVQQNVQLPQTNNPAEALASSFDADNYAKQLFESAKKDPQPLTIRTPEDTLSASSFTINHPDDTAPRMRVEGALAAARAAATQSRRATNATVELVTPQTPQPSHLVHQVQPQPAPSSQPAPSNQPAEAPLTNTAPATTQGAASPAASTTPSAQFAARTRIEPAKPAVTVASYTGQDTLAFFTPKAAINTQNTVDSIEKTLNAPQSDTPSVAGVVSGLSVADVTPAKPVTGANGSLVNYIITDTEAEVPQPSGKEPVKNITASNLHTFTLPGLEGQSINITMLPLVPGLVTSLRSMLTDVQKGCETNQPALVQEAANRLAGKSEIFGLQTLSKIARCVERAAEANDMEAVSHLAVDLQTVTLRHVDSLNACYLANQ